MASPPTSLTKNAGTPLSSDELAADRAASPQSTDPLDKPGAGDTSIVSEDKLTDDEDESRGRGIEEALTMLPPG